MGPGRRRTSRYSRARSPPQSTRRRRSRPRRGVPPPDAFHLLHELLRLCVVLRPADDHRVPKERAVLPVGVDHLIGVGELIVYGPTFIPHQFNINPDFNSWWQIGCPSMCHGDPTLIPTLILTLIQILSLLMGNVDIRVNVGINAGLMSELMSDRRGTLAGTQCATGS